MSRKHEVYPVRYFSRNSDVIPYKPLKNQPVTTRILRSLSVLLKLVTS